MNVYTDKDTNLVMAPDSMVAELSKEVEGWSALDDVFKTVNGLAQMAVIEWKLNERGLTCYDHRDDITMFDRMDKIFANLHEDTKTYWCKSFACACMGCVNHTARENNITEDQWKLWMKSRFGDKK